MEKDHYYDMYNGERDNWWFKGKRLCVFSLIEKFIPAYQSILDIGCGTGILLSEFKKRNKEVCGTDVSADAINLSRKRGIDRVLSIDFSKNHIQDKNFDLITCLDVLEHIEDDKAAVLNIKKNMKKGSYFLLTVPAFQFLWGADDVVLHHKRRYTRTQIMDLVEGANLKVIKCSYSNFFIFPLVWALRQIDKLMPNRKPRTTLKTVPKLLNEFVLLFYRFEAWYLKRFNFPFGSSLVCLAQKVSC